VTYFDAFTLSVNSTSLVVLSVIRNLRLNAFAESILPTLVVHQILETLLNTGLQMKQLQYRGYFRLRQKLIYCFETSRPPYRDLYSSPSIIRLINSRKMRWAGHVARMGDKKNDYRLSVRKPLGKRPLGRQKRRWVDNIRMDLGEVG
jgi:hypothetical protein